MAVYNSSGDVYTDIVVLLPKAEQNRSSSPTEQGVGGEPLSKLLSLPL